MRLAVGTIYLVTQVSGHGGLVHPPSRNAIDAHEVNCDSSTDNCERAGSKHPPKGNGCVNYTHPTESCWNGQASFWYSQGCFIGCDKCDHVSGRVQADICGSGKKPTLPDYARSVNVNATAGSIFDIYKHNPWRAPGNAPVADPCGLAGGWPWGSNGGEAGNYVNTTNAGHGQKGTTLPDALSGAKWTIGGEAEVSWQVRNNHGGGYSYRLCPYDSELTEECFQQHPLDMIPDKAAFQFSGTTVRTSYKPVIVTEGTQPEGSMWARIPVAPTMLGPVCIPGPDDDPNAPYSCAKKNNPTTPCGCTPCPQTPGSDCSRCDDCGSASWPALANFPSGKPVEGVGPVVGIIDVVKVPSSLKPGRYVLGWRYDCEATAQVWSNCADIVLE